MQNHQPQPAWPDSAAFWHDKRVIVTGGSGFLGSFIVDKLRERGAAEVIVPRRADCDLRDIQSIRQLFADVQESAIRNPQSAIRNPQSAVRNPQSAIRNPNCT